MLYSKIGTYIGSGSGTKQITGIGFSPKVVIAWSANTGVGEVGIYWAQNTGLVSYDVLGGLGDNGYMCVSKSGSNAYDFFTSFDADGFSILTGTTYHALNKSGSTFYYLALGGDDVATGSYTGNGADNRAITGVGFQPIWVLIENATQHTVHKFSSSGNLTDICQYTFNAADVSNGIQSLDTDGFTVGSSNYSNYNGSVHYWFAVKASSAIAQGSYSGNSTDNRDISLSITNPVFVFIKSSGAYYMGLRTTDMSGDATKYRSSAGFIANIIQSLGSSSFQVGTDVISNAGTNYHYIAIKLSAPLVATSNFFQFF